MEVTMKFIFCPQVKVLPNRPPVIFSLFIRQFNEIRIELWMKQVVIRAESGLFERRNTLQFRTGKYWDVFARNNRKYLIINILLVFILRNDLLALSMLKGYLIINLSDYRRCLIVVTQKTPFCL